MHGGLARYGFFWWTRAHNRWGTLLVCGSGKMPRLTMGSQREMMNGVLLAFLSDQELLQDKI